MMKKRKLCHVQSMNRTRTALIIATLLVATGWAHEAALGNIMPLDDSINAGYPMVGGYRDALYTNLVNAGCTFTFIGSMTDNASVTLSNAGQAHHEGHPGFFIEGQSTGEAESVWQLEESTDLTNWTPVQSVTLIDGSIQHSEADAVQLRRYFRLLGAP